MTTLFESVDEHARKHPRRAALWQRRADGEYEATTYEELAAAAGQFADAFSRSCPDTRIVPLYLSKSAECVAAMVGASGAGKAFACLNRKLKAPQIAGILRDTAASLALVDGPGLLTLKAALGDPVIAGTRWWVAKGPGWSPMHDRALAECGAVARVEVWPVRDTGAATGADRRSDTDDPKRVGCCLFTSGSTGTPKGVLISEADLLARASAEVACYGLTSDDVLLSILPFSFDVGLNQLLAALRVGCALVLLDSWLPTDILNATEARQVTGISGVPYIWLDFLAKGFRFDRRGPHASLRYITVSGGDMSRQQLEELPAVVDGAGIIKTYGQTEAFRATALLPDQFAGRPSSVGRPFGGVRVYVVHPDGTRAEPNEAGEVVHSGLGTMLGYLGGGDPQQKLRPNPFRGPDDPSATVVYTGDLGHLDEDGFLYVHGRRDGMLKVAGNRIYPQEVAEQLLVLPGVKQAEVVGVDAGRGDIRLVAFIVSTDADRPDPLAIRRELGRRLPSYMVPERVLVRDALPRTASGKPDRQELAAHAAALLAAEPVSAPAS